MADRIMHTLPEVVTTNDLMAWFDNEAPAVYESQLPAKATDSYDLNFWSMPSEREGYKLDHNGNPLALAASDFGGLSHDTYHDTLEDGGIMRGDSLALVDIDDFISDTINNA